MNSCCLSAGGIRFLGHPVPAVLSFNGVSMFHTLEKRGGRLPSVHRTAGTFSGKRILFTSSCASALAGFARRQTTRIIGVSCLNRYGVFIRGFTFAQPSTTLPCLPLTTRWLLRFGFWSRLAQVGCPSCTESMATGKWCIPGAIYMVRALQTCNFMSHVFVYSDPWFQPVVFKGEQSSKNE